MSRENCTENCGLIMLYGNENKRLGLNRSTLVAKHDLRGHMIPFFYFFAGLDNLKTIKPCLVTALNHGVTTTRMTNITSTNLMGVPSAIKVCLDSKLNISALVLGVDSVSSILRDNYSLSSLIKKNWWQRSFSFENFTIQFTYCGGLRTHDLRNRRVAKPTGPQAIHSQGKLTSYWRSHCFAILNFFKGGLGLSKEESDVESLNITESPKLMFFRQVQSGSEQYCRSTGRCFEDSLRWNQYSNTLNAIDRRQCHASFPPSIADKKDFGNGVLSPFCPRLQLSYGSESIHTDKSERTVSSNNSWHFKIQ